MIWLVGHKGMLGSEVEVLLRESGVPFVCTDRDVDITNAESIGQFLESLHPTRLEWIINCAAYTAVDNAEDEKESAFAVNAAGPLHLARAARAAGAALAHISTDYVLMEKKNRTTTKKTPPIPLTRMERAS